MTGNTLDILTIGRTSVDLYGEQIGGKLEDMRSFRKYIGGSPTNMAAGMARLGLKAGLITKVGDEQFGRFIREALIQEGVDVRGVLTDPTRLTSLAILGIRDQEQFPLLFYRENCADMAICEDDIDADLIAEANAVLVTGTHLSQTQPNMALQKALRLAKSAHRHCILDIDYRPNLWGLAGHAEGENRFIASEHVTKALQDTLSLFDVIVGTEEEYYIAGGSTHIQLALQNVRAHTQAALVLKQGAQGATVFEDSIPDNLEHGIRGRNFSVEIFNVLGAGDGFMAGLMRGWLRGEDWQTSLSYANACGAFAVSRHGCTPSYPSWTELQYFLKHGSSYQALRKDKTLSHIHWATNRPQTWPLVRIFAFDHRAPFEHILKSVKTEISDADAQELIKAFKKLCLRSLHQVAQGAPGYGILCDDRFGQEVLWQSTEYPLWVGRPLELPGSRPVMLEPYLGKNLTATLKEWPTHHVVKLLCFYHPDDDQTLKEQQDRVIQQVFEAARANHLSFLLEIVASKVGECHEETTAQIIDHVYRMGVFPDWWKLEPNHDHQAWEHICKTIHRHDPYCCGVIVLGLEASIETLQDCFNTAARFDTVKGFAIGRTLFAEAAKSWFAHDIDDQQAITQMANTFKQLCDIWDKARKT